ncbi:MAG: fatty acid desaturase [Cytophagaceae bacterium]|jgi:omega-6 fatty acid desaturase (delta-12 desaturase)|nr:fatty acid desaturase [Cytophagaceae bacterium]
MILEGKKLILATKPFAKEERPKSWMHTISTLVLLICAYASIYWVEPVALKIFFCILASLISVRMFIIYHDYLHKTILQNSAMANVIFTLFGLYILSPRSVWKRSHDYHHKHNSKLFTSSVGSFPIVTKEKFLSLRASDRRAYLFIRHPLTILLGHIFTFTFGLSLLPLMRSPDKHWDAAIALVLHYSLAVLIYMVAGPLNFALAFLLPAFISGAMGSYLFYAQHNFPGTHFEDKEGWTYISAAMNSSSYMKMNKLMHWFTGNIGYHHIHHLNARIPFYRLPEAFEKIPELQSAKTTSLNPIDIFRCLRLKVWDVETKTMIGHRELAKGVVSGR